MRAIIFLVVIVTIVNAIADPPPPPFPKLWPRTWYTWVVTTILQGENTTFNKGQLISFDLDQQLTCRYNQQDLISKSPVRPADLCDHVGLFHYSVNDTSSYSGCSGTTQLSNPLTQVQFPDELAANAQFVGIDHIATQNCNHFLGTQLNIGGKNVQMDVWTGVDNGYPCQMSILDLGTNVVTIFAFVGFSEKIPPNIMQCSSPKLICKESDWVCRPKDGIENDELGKQLQWVCNPSNLDCSPINPGGSFFEPNNVQSHCTWAFNTYFKAKRGDQGTGACNFGGTGELVPPTYFKEKTQKRQNIIPWAVFPPDVVCA